MRATVLLTVCTLALGTLQAGAAEVVRLNSSAWRGVVPRGKEVDAIYGDLVLRNEQVVAVIGDPLPTRNANMTVRNVGFAVIDFTERSRPNDQLSAFYPASAAYRFTSSDSLVVEVDGQPRELDGAAPLSGRQIRVSCTAEPAAGKPRVTVRYTIEDNQPYLLVETIYRNESDQPIREELRDTVRADRTFTFGIDAGRNLFWAHDEWFRQAYGIQPLERSVSQSGTRGVVIEYPRDGSSAVEIPAGGEVTLQRRLLVAANQLALVGQAGQLLGEAVIPVTLRIEDSNGPIGQALVKVQRDGQLVATARTPRGGELRTYLPAGDYQVTASAIGRPEQSTAIKVLSEGPNELVCTLPASGYVRARITDEQGQPTPCKVAFHGIDGTETPDFGPDSATAAVKNLRYTANGRFRQAIGPGKYQVIVSLGPEYDVVRETIEVRAGETTELTARLHRSVDTTGWVTADFHSHSTPSGDNTASQRGRVLNLLGEHIEFAPCTEHNRISSYVPHLRQLNAERFLATCSGLELTGNPLPINHQNAFPLVPVPRTQDNGAPLTDENPIVQIERLAMWDSGGAEKLVQINHPNLVQMIGDRDMDGTPDGGFAEMFQFMDVIEVHPLESILLRPGTPEFDAQRAKAIFHWMQMLNLGYRAPGVVNTDSHYNFHGSGGLFNFVRSSTDDPAQISVAEMVESASKGWLVMSNGPFLEVSLVTNDGKTVGPGDEVAVPGGEAVLRVRVQCPNWFDINRVQVFLNGRPAEDLNFTRREHPERFSNETVRFQAELPVKLGADTHIIVAAAGEGLELGEVMGPSWGKQAPTAVANPIFVDVDGNGFQPNGDLLDFPLPL